MRLSAAERLSKRLHVTPGGCWEFQGYCGRGGYGHIRVFGSTWGWVYTHRVAWETAFGPIPAGLHVLHTCDNPPCCNPAHLFLGTQTDNAADMQAKGRGHTGEKSATAKLTWEQADAIRVDDRQNTAIAAEYGVHDSTIGDIKLGKTWRKAQCAI